MRKKKIIIVCCLIIIIQSFLLTYVILNPLNVFLDALSISFLSVGILINISTIYDNY